VREPLSADVIAELRRLFGEGVEGLAIGQCVAALHLLDEVERSRALLKRIEWGSETGGCPECRGGFKHFPGCKLAALIGVR
jgi:hypothetical protein